MQTVYTIMYTEEKYLAFHIT